MIPKSKVNKKKTKTQKHHNSNHNIYRPIFTTLNNTLFVALRDYIRPNYRYSIPSPEYFQNTKSKLSCKMVVIVSRNERHENESKQNNWKKRRIKNKFPHYHNEVWTLPDNERWKKKTTKLINNIHIKLFENHINMLSVE